MKTIIFLLILISSCAGAQTSFSCYHREDCGWNEVNQKFDICEGRDEYSLFYINEQETIITHTTYEQKSAYYVDGKEYNDSKKLWMYEVTSDVGNKYIFAFDPRNAEVRCVFKKDEETFLVRFYVKAVF